MCRQYLLLIVFLYSLSAPLFASANPARQSYFSARRWFLKKNWDKAKDEFQRTLTLIQKLPSRTKDQKLFINLGWCDIQYHLALIQQAQNQPMQACHTFQQLTTRIAVVEKTWPRWRRKRINLLLPGRFRDAKKRFAQCSNVPTLISLAQLPPQAKVSLYMAPKDGAPESWKEVTPPFQTLEQSIKLRVTAPGYLPEERTFTVSPWVENKFEFPLKVKPKPRPRVRDRIIVPPPTRPPERRKIPPPIPIYKKPWFWVAVGGSVVVVVTGIAIGAYVASQQPKTLQPTCPNNNNCFPFP